MIDLDREIRELLEEDARLAPPVPDAEPALLRTRRRQLFVVVVTLVSAVVLVIGAVAGVGALIRSSERRVPANPPGAAEWSQFGYGPGRTFSNPSETTLTTANLAGLHLAWKADLGRDVDTSPVVVDGVVYVGSNHAHEAALSAVDASTGEILWSVETLPPHVSSPAVADGLVFAETGIGTSAFDVATGDEVWTRPRPTPSDMTLPPAVVGGVVYVASPPEEVAALDAASGEEIWSTGPPIGPGGIAVADGLVYVDGLDRQGAESKILALDASTGETVWRWGHPRGSSTPLVADGVVYMVGCAFDASTGAPAWSACIGRRPTAPIAFERGTLFTFLWGIGGMFALDASTGETLWHGDLRPSISLGNGILFANENIECRFSAGRERCPSIAKARLLLVDSSTGETLRIVRLATWEPRGWDPFPPSPPPAISDGVVYVGVAVTHELVALHL